MGGGEPGNKASPVRFLSSIIVCSCLATLKGWAYTHGLTLGGGAVLLQGGAGQAAGVEVRARGAPGKTEEAGGGAGVQQEARHGAAVPDDEEARREEQDPDGQCC